MNGSYSFLKLQFPRGLVGKVAGKRIGERLSVLQKLSFQEFRSCCSAPGHTGGHNRGGSAHTSYYISAGPTHFKSDNPFSVLTESFPLKNKPTANVVSHVWTWRTTSVSVLSPPPCLGQGLFVVQRWVCQASRLVGP